MSLSRPELEELERLNREATPGPWEWWTSNSMRRLTGPSGQAGGVAHAFVAHDRVPDIAIRDEDMRLIAELRNNATALLESASFAERAAAFLREHGEMLASGLAKLSWAHVHRGGRSDTSPAEPAEHALAELLRSLPAQSAK